MNYIEHIKIEGFWGDKTVSLKFNEKENFLIGVNGSGKTTIINLIVAVITADFAALDRIEFKNITLSLRNKNDKRKRPKLEVEKREVSQAIFKKILLRIKSSSSESPFEVFLDEVEEERMYRYPSDEYVRGLWHSSSGGWLKSKKDLQYQLNRLFNVSWLSIHRYKASYRVREEKPHVSLVDQKINEFSTNLLKYLSQLKSLADEETDKFQKFFFLSLISVQEKAELYQTLSSVNSKKEKASLAEIYKLFKLKDSEYKTKLDKFYKEYEKAYQKQQESSITIKDAEYLLGTRRNHSVVEEWNKLVNKKKEIYLYRDTFRKIINGLLQRKELIINDKNELQVKTQSGKILDLKDLSSGEKQLVIIMGEILLQRSEPHIFIADEPELSLHIEWQEKLVDSLNSLNPNCQIIFATHSPDIVSHYPKSVIEIEEHIK